MGRGRVGVGVRKLFTGGRHPPPGTIWALKKILVETLNNVGHPTRRPQPVNSVRLMVSCVVQRLRNDFLKPTLYKGGGPGHLLGKLLLIHS